MKTILSIALLILFSTNTNAQAPAATATLLPDQNPNYQKSRDKYMQESTTLTQNEGQTVQQTYKAIDDVQAKKERKELAAERRQDRRMARIQSRGNRRSNRGYYNNGYYNNGYYNNGYYSNPSGFYSPQYYSNNIYGNVGSVLNTALLGLTVWSLLKK
jgi:hypothetical protein